MRYLKQILLFYLLIIQVAFGNEASVILVTGGAGYIGSHTCKVLKDAGFIPVTYDSLAQGDKESVKWGPLVVGDLLDHQKLEKTFEEYKPIAVIHFAALRNVGESVYDPSSYYTNNIAGSINLLNAMLKYQVKQIIFSSSCTVYGVCETNPIDESFTRAPINPYAMSKYVVERMIEDFAYAYGFKYMILRYFNAAGIDLDAGLKRSQHSQTFLIPKTLLALLNTETPLKVFGSDYPTHDGTAIRDYIHVKDLARAHVLALCRLQQGEKSEAINLGTGNGYSVFEIIKAIENITNKTVHYEIMPRREGDVPEAVANPEKSERILNFKTESSDLTTIIETEWKSLTNKGSK